MRKRLCIISNFGPGVGQVGGSEYVIMAIAEGLLNSYDATIFARNYTKPSLYKGASLVPSPKGNALISQLSNFDHILIYSDSSWEFPNILDNINKIKCKISLVLVGAYFLQSNLKYLDILKNNISKFNLITHSKITPDYKWCIDNSLPVRVVPNGTDLLEFKDNTINFREKYNIKEKYIINSTGNLFFGKGFDVLPKIAKNLKAKLGDFIILSISSTVKYTYDKRFLQQTKQQSKGLPIRFLRDLSREDVIASFKTSDILVLPSKKEVAPLVLLEARASKTPWLSMTVGNAEDVPGGVVIHNSNVDNKGYKIVNSDIVDNFAEEIKSILLSNELRKQLISEGQRDIYKLDWSKIVPEYNRMFNL